MAQGQLLNIRGKGEFYQFFYRAPHKSYHLVMETSSRTIAEFHMGEMSNLPGRWKVTFNGKQLPCRLAGRKG